MVAELDFRRVSAKEGDGAALLVAMTDEMRELYSDVGMVSHINSPISRCGAADLSHARWHVPGRVPRRRTRLWRVASNGSETCSMRDQAMYVVRWPRQGDRQGAAMHVSFSRPRRANSVMTSSGADTGPRQPHARGRWSFFRRGLQREIPNFNGNPVATFFGEKRPWG